jgi:hypothetical protein
MHDHATRWRERSGKKGNGALRRTYFLLDAIVNVRARTAVVEVLSFASKTKDWSNAERDAGHFLYAVEHVKTPAAAVIKPPSEVSADSDR